MNRWKGYLSPSNRRFEPLEVPVSLPSELAKREGYLLYSIEILHLINIRKLHYMELRFYSFCLPGSSNFCDVLLLVD